MDFFAETKKIFGPTRRDFIENILILSYFIIANVWSWYFIPEVQLIISPFFLFPLFFFAFVGLIFGGLKGCAYGAALIPGSLIVMNAAFFPIFFAAWILGLLAAYLSTIPFPLAGSVGKFLFYSLAGLALLFLILLLVIDHIYGKKPPVSREDESDDYSSPGFTMSAGGGRWGGI